MTGIANSKTPDEAKVRALINDRVKAFCVQMMRDISKAGSGERLIRRSYQSDTDDSPPRPQS